MKVLNFEEWLIEYHSDNTDALDDEQPDEFNDWIGGLEPEDWFRLADKFAKYTAEIAYEEGKDEMFHEAIRRIRGE